MSVVKIGEAELAYFSLSLATPLTPKLSVRWTDAAKHAFASIKTHIASATSLRHAKAEAPTCMLTDASDVAVVAVLQQRRMAADIIRFALTPRHRTSL